MTAITPRVGPPTGTSSSAAAVDEPASNAASTSKPKQEIGWQRWLPKIAIGAAVVVGAALIVRHVHLNRPEVAVRNAHAAVADAKEALQLLDGQALETIRAGGAITPKLERAAATASAASSDARAALNHAFGRHGVREGGLLDIFSITRNGLKPRGEFAPARLYPGYEMQQLSYAEFRLAASPTHMLKRYGDVRDGVVWLGNINRYVKESSTQLDAISDVLRSVAAG